MCKGYESTLRVQAQLVAAGLLQYKLDLNSFPEKQQKVIQWPFLAISMFFSPVNGSEVVQDVFVDAVHEHPVLSNDHVSHYSDHSKL